MMRERDDLTETDIRRRLDALATFQRDLHDRGEDPSLVGESLGRLRARLHDPA